MGQYTKKGLYNGYDKKNKEREALDYYATPPQEVFNILNTLQLDLSNSTVLDPCCGGGHIMEGILKYQKPYSAFGTDIMDREKCQDIWYNYDTKDFLSEEYPITSVDYVITNPPFSVIIPFTLHALEIAEKGVLQLGRIQFTEGEKRYEEVLKQFKPTAIYSYVDRIACYKNGDFSVQQHSAQQYAWFYWDKEIMKQKEYNTNFYWERKIEKKLIK